MAEELRFFLRIGLFAALIATIYWFVSYEVAGTILLAGIVFSVGVLVVTVGKAVKPARDDIAPETTSGPGRSGADGGRLARLGIMAKRTITFEEESEPASSSPLQLADEPIAHTSAWPILTAVSALLIGLGFLWGGWFWGPGLGLALLAAWGWSSQIHD